MKGEGANVECTNNGIAALLPDFFSGHLSGGEAEAVQAHLATCPVCRESLQTMSLLAPEGFAGQKSHPSKDLLAGYYRDRAGLTPEVSTLIEKHLAECDECAGELAILDGTERELRASVAEAGFSGTTIQSLVRRYGQVVAYAAAACLLIMVGYRVMTPGGIATEPLQIYQLSESTRSDRQSPEIVVDSDDNAVILEVPFYHMRDEHNYTAAVVGGDGQPTAARIDRMSFPQPGQIRMRLDVDDLKSGEYQLVVRESKHGQPSQTTQTYYAFKLVTVD